MTGHTVTDRDLTQTDEVVRGIRAVAAGYPPAIVAAALVYELVSTLAAEAPTLADAEQALARFAAIGRLQLETRGVGHPHAFTDEPRRLS